MGKNARATTLKLPPADKSIQFIVFVLGAIGVVAVYSAFSFLARHKADGDTERFLIGHVARLIMALGIMGFVSLIPYRLLAKFSKIALLVSLVLLIAVHLVGVSQGGAQRWINFGAFGFQPSDLAKVALILYVGSLLSKKQEYIKGFSRAFLPIVLWVMATVFLIGMEDLSTAAMVVVTVGAMCFVGRVSLLHIGGLVMVCTVLATLLLLASPNRAARVEAYLGVNIFPHTAQEEVFNDQAEGFQARQARIAIANGGITGKGPGRSMQRDFLPAPYNDFIFAIITEEYGLIGAGVLLILFLWFLFRGMQRVARRAPDPLGFFLATGFTTMIVVYGFVHAGVSCGLLPVTGLPLPFVSYGGTSMMANGIMVGIILNISRYGDSTR